MQPGAAATLLGGQLDDPSHPAAETTSSRQKGPRRISGTTVAVIVAGLLVTATLTVVSETSYRHNEQRLTTLQSKLTASLIGTAPVQLEGQLARVVGLSAESPDPVATFEQAIDPSLAPTGPYTSAVLVLVGNGQQQVLAHVGQKAIRSPQSTKSVAVYNQAARSSSLVTTRAIGHGVQRLGYFMSARGQPGTFVVGASQQLPLHKLASVPASSPDANLNFAIYFGRHPGAGSLIESNVHPPLTGIVSTSTVPFGSNVLTLVVSSRGSLSGPWAELLPWGVLVVGVLLTAFGALMTEHLVRRRSVAESLAQANRALYQQQRDVATTLQHALLPRAFPEIPSVEFAARYIPSTSGAAVGGDWYSVVSVAEGQFAFVVGDVSGHDIGAASVMGAMRYTVRTLAKLGFSPAEILDRTNQEIDISTDGYFATVLVGTVDLVRSEVTLSSAGHPPPVMVDRAGGRGGRFPVVPTGPPLGVTSQRYTSVTTPFDPGDILVAYTDGLVERRGEDIDLGLQRLVAIATRSTSSADGLVDGLVSELVGTANADDVAILAISRQSSGGDAAAAGGPSAASSPGPSPSRRPAPEAPGPTVDSPLGSTR
jgi:serine phosphatase RsbU (regulator of sigma subunit)